MTGSCVATGAGGSGGGGDDSPEQVEYGEHYERVNGKKRLRPNVEYTDPAGHTYRTDSNGRIINVEGELHLARGKRNAYAQSHVGGADRLPTDDGGHLIGSQFEGSGNIDNLIPQSRTINRAGGEWYRMEQTWAEALRKGETVRVNISPHYSGNSMRPDFFEVIYTIGDAQTVSRTIVN